MPTEDAFYEMNEIEQARLLAYEIVREAEEDEIAAATKESIEQFMVAAGYMRGV